MPITRKDAVSQQHAPLRRPCLAWLQVQAPPSAEQKPFGWQELPPVRKHWFLEMQALPQALYPGLRNKGGVSKVEIRCIGK